MTEPVVVDTDVLIDYLRGRPGAAAFLEELDRPPLISAITIGELYAGVRDGEKEALAGFLALFEIVPITEEISRSGGLFRRDYGPSHGTGLVDALIAATAVSHGARLATLNRRHYPMLDDVVTPY